MNDLQRIELDMYLVVADICERHGLRYYAYGGTLLGAVRHQGFIPWDDDLDLMMPRPDYELFWRVIHEELPEGYGAFSYRNDKDNPYASCYCQVKRLDTKVRLEIGNKPMETSVWIDVFPLDGMPSGGLRLALHKIRLLYRRMLFNLSRYDDVVNQLKKNRPLHERAIMKFRELTNLGSNWDPYDCYLGNERALRKYDFDKEELCWCGYGSLKFKEIFPTSWFADVVQIPFESTTIPCVTEYDKMLTSLYGDYMVPPPVEERDQRHCMTVISLGENGPSTLR